MLRVGLEPKTTMFQRGKTFRALDRAATEIGTRIIKMMKSSEIRRAVNVHVVHMNDDRYIHSFGWKPE
jgi:hypothetical protein